MKSLFEIDIVHSEESLILISRSLSMQLLNLRIGIIIGGEKNQSDDVENKDFYSFFKSFFLEKRVGYFTKNEQLKVSGLSWASKKKRGVTKTTSFCLWGQEQHKKGIWNQNNELFLRLLELMLYGQKGVLITDQGTISEF